MILSYGLSSSPPSSFALQPFKSLAIIATSSSSFVAFSSVGFSVSDIGLVTFSSASPAANLNTTPSSFLILSSVLKISANAVFKSSGSISTLYTAAYSLASAFFCAIYTLDIESSLSSACLENITIVCFSFSAVV